MTSRAGRSKLFRMKKSVDEIQEQTSRHRRAEDEVKHDRPHAFAAQRA
jgi:hypothetical protein